MTENEALKHIQSYAVTVDVMIGYCRDFEPKADITGYLEKKTVFDMATAALKEIQQYRKIGTVEECQEAVEKREPKECVIDSCPDHTHYKCPSCGKIHLSRYKHGFPSLGRIPRFCDHCGQAIDWEESEE